MVGGQAVHGWQHTLFGHDSTTEAGVQRAPRPHRRRPARTPRRARRSTPSATTASARPSSARTCRTRPPGCRGCARWWACARTRRACASTRCRPPADSGHAPGRPAVAEGVAGVRPVGEDRSSSSNAGRGFHSNDARGVVARPRRHADDAVPALVAEQGRGARACARRSCRACRPRWPSGAWTAIPNSSTPPTRAAPSRTAPAGATASSGTTTSCSIAGCWSTPTWRGRTRATPTRTPTATRATTSATRSAASGLLGVTRARAGAVVGGPGHALHRPLSAVAGRHAARAVGHRHQPAGQARADAARARCSWTCSTCSTAGSTTSPTSRTTA